MPEENKTKNLDWKNRWNKKLFNWRNRSKCVSISALASLVGIPVGITISASGLKICAITVGIKKYTSMIKKKKKKKHEKIVLLAKSKLSSIEVIISKAFTDLNISND